MLHMIPTILTTIAVKTAVKLLLEDGNSPYKTEVSVNNMLQRLASSKCGYMVGGKDGGVFPTQHKIGAALNLSK